MTSTIQEPTANGFTLVRVHKLISVPENSTVEVDLSSYVPSGESIFAISSMKLGRYVLPYISSLDSSAYTCAVGLENNKLSIRNTASAWNNYVLDAVLFCV